MKDFYIDKGVKVGGLSGFIKITENSILIGIPTIGTILCFPYFFNQDYGLIELSSFIIGYAVTGFGVGLGFHRYFTHRSYEVGRLLEICLAAAGSMAFQGSILRWVADHRRHHVWADKSGDPHSPHVRPTGETFGLVSGLFHAHLGWMFDLSTTDYRIYAKDLVKNRFIMFFHKTYWMWVVISLLLPWLWGYILSGGDLNRAMGSMLFGGCFRAFALHHVTWSVNSICHSFGHADYKKDNKSTNNAPLALLMFGEGWHNNHHAFPRSAYHGIRIGQLDINGLIITALERIGLVKNVLKSPTGAISDQVE